MKNGDREALRLFDGTETPVLVVTFNIQKFCHHNVETQTADDDIVTVKVRPTKPFLRELNERVYTILQKSIENALLDYRSNLMVQDIPTQLDFQKEENA